MEPDGERSDQARGISLFSLAALATTAVLIGHHIAYLLAFPNAGERAAVLGDAGHAYLPIVSHFAVLAGLAAVGTLFLRSLALPHAETTVPSRRFARLALVQVAMFVGLETAERVATGTPIANVAERDLLWIGIAVQVALALVVTVVVMLIARAGDAVASIAMSAFVPPRAETVATIAPRLEFARTRSHGVAAPRAPPSA
jgi:hypothetical protein